MTDPERVAYATTVLLESKWARRQQQPEDERDQADLVVSVQEVSELLGLPRSVVVQSLADFEGAVE
jgi:hypothetical protein